MPTRPPQTEIDTRGRDAVPAAPPPSPWFQRIVGRFLQGGASSAAAPPARDGGLSAAVLDALPDAVLVVDADDRVRAANGAVEEVLGYAPDRLVGLGVAEVLLPAAHREAYAARLRQAGEGGAAGPGERLQAVRADGSPLAVEVSVRPVSEGGEPLFAVCVRDVGASQATEAALAAAEGWQRVLRTVVDAIPDPVVAVDRAGKVVLRNRASGPAGDRTLPAPEREGADAVMRTGTPVRDQEEPRPAGGVQLTTRVPVRDRTGAVVGLVAISRDVTAQKAAEAKLRDAKQAAEASAAANGEFLATTSHEVRTLMSGVTGMTTLLLDTDLDDEQREFVETVRTSSEALLTVINDTLDFSKIESGLLSLEDRPFEVHRVAKEALSMVAQQAAAKGLALACEVADDVPDAVRGDATRVKQVLANLLTNAVKFTTEGSVRVHVGLAPPADGRPVLEFAVEDTGVGIAPDRLEAVFERFTQADASTTRTHGGTGLGLAICKRLVGMMGGELSADSVHGEGSVFRFTVAVRPPADGPEGAAPGADAPAAEQAPAGGAGDGSAASAPWRRPAPPGGPSCQRTPSCRRRGSCSPRTTRSTSAWPCSRSAAWGTAPTSSATAPRPSRPSAATRTTWC